jgi:hypothetical protein
MGKIIRRTYSLEISIGLLLLVFVISFFLSGQIFRTSHAEVNGNNIYFGMFLVSCAFIVMSLVLWEEFLFPIKVKPEKGGYIFRNHRTKLKQQILFYLLIPVIFTVVYFNFELNFLRFLIWAGVCILLPVAGKLISGIKNYNDFLKLTDEGIEYRNNQKMGKYALGDLKGLQLVRDDRSVLHRIKLILINNDEVLIDLDEMELEAFIPAIDQFVNSRFKNLINS